MMRIFVAPDQLAAGELTVRGDEHHYLARVRRARPGDAVELVDGAGRRAAATIARLSDRETTLVAGPPEVIAQAPPRVRALVPLLKGDRMELCIEKLVEVGADVIVVWPAARSVARLDDSRRDARIAKLRAIAQAAARQSGRAQVPEVSAAASLGAALDALPEARHRGQRLVLDPTSSAALDAADDDVTIVSGPEGGLAPGELDQLAGFTPLGLGPRVLRAETAPVVAVALIRAANRS
ncbi:MAG: 16S rRNA (uracil(1498)-N(3))-methyltransferase [Deltaproteobacteria bacterium]|nr:MAG: 16S rRNA (uracil(1498)-N(3))-methyltransferase [Deltaproteobacteria bacterium]